jgi:Cys-tRNA synthase (O-phospho-L-seryl-tRNA:Cys-tRNA synthase)
MRRDRGGAREGVVLLEAIVALVILATAGATIVTMTAEAAHAVHQVRGAEEEVRAANAFFSAVSLWSREDLDRHLGDRVQGSWMMRVDRPAPTLYVATLSDTATHRALLRTSLYRPEESHVAP